MQVKILQAFVEGVGQALNPGYIISPPEHIAKDWISRGLAAEFPPAAAPVAVRAPIREVATSIKKAVEKRVKRGKR